MASNKKYLEAVETYSKQLEALAGQEVVVGIPASKNERHDDSDLTLAQIGAIHEYGAPEAGIERRSFLRVPLSMEAGNLFKQIEKDLKFSKINTSKALGRLGAGGQSVVLKAFKTQGEGTWKKLSKATERRRKKGKGSGSNKPLIDSGQLRRSITYEVRDI